MQPDKIYSISFRTGELLDFVWLSKKQCFMKQGKSINKIRTDYSFMWNIFCGRVILCLNMSDFAFRCISVAVSIIILIFIFV